MRLQIRALTEKGCVREQNEDRVLLGTELLREGLREVEVELAEDSRYVMGIADGMGGHQAGEIAAEMLLLMLSDKVRSLRPGLSAGELEQGMREWAQTAHLRLLEEGEKDLQKKGMGTTLAGVLLYEGRIYYMSAGDSRIYRLRSGVMAPINEEHALQSGALLNSFGGGRTVFLEFGEIRVFEGDILLLCSDGLTRMLSEEEIESLLSSGPHSLESLVARAVERGGYDNISVICVHVG
jgi:serine/threonine protein phosphatase PrpC